MQRVLDRGCDLEDPVDHLDRAERLPCFFGSCKCP